MSTRSIIVVTGNARYNSKLTNQFYKHSDGYPTGNLPIIAETIKQVVELLADDFKKFSTNTSSKPMHEMAEVFSGKLIGNATSIYGMGAELEKSYPVAFEPKHIGNHGDVEWMYIIDLIKKDVSIYAGCDVKDLKKGPTNPETYISQLRDECQAEELAETKALVASIRMMGFTVNGKIEDKKPAKKLTKKQKENMVNEAYNKSCSGIAINMMDITKVFKAGMHAVEAGNTGQELQDLIRSYVETIRQN